MGEPDAPRPARAPASPSDLRMVRSEVNFLTYPFFCLDNPGIPTASRLNTTGLWTGRGREEISWRVLAPGVRALPAV